METNYCCVTKCSECPFYTEFRTNLYLCLCLLTNNVILDDYIPKTCPLIESDYEVYLHKKEAKFAGVETGGN